MSKQVVLCDAYGTLKPQQINGRQAEMSDLLNSFQPSTAPSAEVVAAALSAFPTAEGLARLAQNRWARTTFVAGHQEILDAFIKMFESEASSSLKPAAAQFMADFRGRIVKLVQDSLALFGACEGAVYDEVYGEGADKAKIPAYLPVVSHFQLFFHEIGNDPAVQAAWVACLAACQAELPTQEAGLGSSPARRALIYMLSLGEDIAYVRLCQALLHASCEFKV